MVRYLGCSPITTIFTDFEAVLGPVGAAKCLHLLVPRFFPLWDRKITEGYGLPLRGRGRNGERYCRWMAITKEQCAAFGGEQALGRNPVKAIDEYNYITYTLELDINAHITVPKQPITPERG